MDTRLSLASAFKIGTLSKKSATDFMVHKTKVILVTLGSTQLSSVAEELEVEDDDEDEDEEDEGHKGRGEREANEEEVGRDKEDMTNLLKDERQQLRRTRNVRVSEYISEQQRSVSTLLKPLFITHGVLRDEAPRLTSEARPPHHSQDSSD